METSGQPPYRRIALDLQRRITSGELRPGDRVPSTRALVRDWGVAMATATRVLAELSRDGWVRAVPGSGTVVSDRSPERTRQARSQAEPALSRDRLVRMAILFADAEGRAALTMRRLAAELGVGAMSLYRHVPDKEELLRLMADAAFGEEPLPDPGPDGWRARLGASARVQWRAYRRHPWLAPTLLNSLTSPPVVASGMRHVDWILHALSGLGLDDPTMFRVAVTLNGYVGGMAMSRSLEVESEQDTGISVVRRREADNAMLIETLHSGRYPTLAALAERVAGLGGLDELFEFGLQRHLDGIAVLLEERGR